MTASQPSPVTYDELAEFEREADDIDTDLMRYQVQQYYAYYLRRSQTISQIPNFWPLVLEQAPPEIDQYIQPSDSPLLLSHLTSLSVSHFELATPSIDQLSSASGLTLQPLTSGEPRSIAITMTFSENPYITNQSLEKRFWFRRARSGWCGLVSEPVRIDWKDGKDLTGGLLDLVCDAHAEVQAQDKTSEYKNGKGPAPLTPKQEALKKRIDSTGLGGVSFFMWFGYIGRRISAAESNDANEALRKSREERKSGNRNGETDAGDASDPPTLVEIDEEDELSLEILPASDELAVAISEDVWPGAIRYFTQAQEEGDALSDAGFESDAEIGVFDGSKEEDELSRGDSGISGASDHEEEGTDAPPAKRARR